MHKARVPEWATSALTLVIVVGVAYVIWGLAANNRELKEEVSRLDRELRTLQETTALQVSLKAGDTVPDTPLVGPSEEQSTLSALVADGGVIAFLTTTCPYCKENLPTWSALAEKYAARGVPFFGVMLDADGSETAQYAAEQQLKWPVWVISDPADTAGLSVAIVPLTVLVDPAGRASTVWAGLLGEEESTTLAAALDGELLESQRVLSGSPVGDPDCCANPTMGTDAGSGQ